MLKSDCICHQDCGTKKSLGTLWLFRCKSPLKFNVCWNENCSRNHYSVLIIKNRNIYNIYCDESVTSQTRKYLLWSKIPRFKLGSNDPRLGMRISFVYLSVPRGHDCNAIHIGVTAKEWISTGVTKTQQLFTLFGTESKIPSRIVKRTTLNLWLSSLDTVKLLGIIISRWESFLVFRKCPT